MLIKHEGVKHKPYVDTTGHRTIGAGINLDVPMSYDERVFLILRDFDRSCDDGDGLPAGVDLSGGIDDVEVYFLLCNRVQQAMEDLDAVLPCWTELDTSRQNALVDMMYNLGRTRFSEFKNMIAAVKERDFDTAAEEMLDSLWARQVHGRARTLASMMKGH
jgi:lysozyme